MSFVKALANRILRNNVRKLEEQDVWRLYHVVHFYNAAVAQGRQISEDYKPPNQSVSPEEQYRIVYTHIKDQITTRLRMTSEPLQESSTRDFTLLPLPPKDSTSIPGVLVKGGPIHPGAFVCFFPGTVYIPSQLKEMPNYPSFADSNPYLMSRTDGSIIDAKDTRFPSDGKSLALGHIVRHPPKGLVPNVMPFSFDVGTDFPKDLLPLVPNRYHRKPGFLFSDSRIVLRTLVFIATQYIRDGDELLLNYRLHPDSTVPEWYSRVEASEDEKRWSN